MFLFVRLVFSNYCRVIFNILTSLNRDLTMLKFLSLVNTTGNSPIYFEAYGVVVAKILALVRLSVNFFQLRLTKKLKINSFVSKS